MTRDPRISVLLPARDAAATLPAALASIARQSERNFECVVVDDGSTDATAAVVRAASARDARFVLVEQPGQGLVPALLAGLARCRGAFIARMDGDDLMHRHRLARQAAALAADPSLAAVGCHVRPLPRRAGDGRADYEAWLRTIRTAEDVAREAFVECPIAHPTWMVRAAALHAHPYREVPWPEDYDVLLRWHAAGLRVGVVPARLLLWREHPARLSRTDERYGLDRFRAAKVHFLCTGFLHGHARYVLWGYGSTGRELVRALAARGRTPTAIVELHPGRLGNRIAGADVVPPAALQKMPRRPLLVSVVGVGPRAEIRAELASLGYQDGIDFLCVA